MRMEEDIITEKFSELRSLISDYARQEIRDPLTALVKWLSLGLLGMLFLLVGISLASLGLLRLLQNEFTTFGNSLSFVPYIIVFATLVILIAISINALRKRE